MTLSRAPLPAFFAANPAVVRIALTAVRGSSPRNAGTEMYVARDTLWGTIGGGRLEHIAIEAARDMLAKNTRQRDMEVPLGPEIGQCCGGHVALELDRMRPSHRRAAELRAQAARSAQPRVYVMGAGHVGRALADLFQHLPVNCILIDTRAEEIALNRAQVETRVTALPEADIWQAPEGSAFVVTTHDHGLDFLLTSAALERGDAGYVGMIGSATKRAKFKSWAHRNCDGQTIEHLNCPIGASGSRDKRPSVIAAFVVAEVIAELTSETAATAPTGAYETPVMGNH